MNPYTKQGHENLKKYYQTYLHSGFETETYASELELASLPLLGTLDETVT